MAEQYDGFLRLKTLIDTKDASSQFLKLEASAEKLKRSIELLSQKKKDLENLKIPTEGFKDAQEKLKGAEAELKKFTDQIKMYQDSPEWMVNMNLLQALYHNHPINIDIAGTVDTIAEITPDTLYDCYNSYYNLNNMVLCVSGNVSLDDVMEVADSKLKDNEPVVTESIFPDEPYEVKQSFTEQKLPIAVPLFAVGFKENAPKSFASSKELLCTSILLKAFAGQSSALYRRLLDEKLVNANFGTEYMEGCGYRSVIFSGESREPEKAADIIKEEVVRLHETGISKEDFEIAKRSVYGGIAYSFDSNYAIAAEVINAEFTGRGIFEDADIIADITLDDINERLKEQLDPNNCSLSVIKGLD